MARLPLREAAAPVDIEPEEPRRTGLTDAQQEALYFSRKRRRLRLGAYVPPEPEEPEVPEE